jgi:aryl-alcohol dehydrogenase-like predicted oxidoreductase
MHQSSPRVIPLIGPRTSEQLDNLTPALEVKLTDEQLIRLDNAGV